MTAIGLLVMLACQSAMAAEPQWWTNQKRACGLDQNLDYNTWVRQGSPCHSGNAGNTNYDNGAAQRAQAAAAAAAAQRQREAELERQRIEAANKRRMEAVEEQDKFIEDRDAAAITLRGSTGVNASGGQGDSGLRGSSASTELRGSNTDAAQAPDLDPMVVDARNVPTGLPKSVEAAIPDTPSGRRVRKGFEAVMDHDWSVALAWFQDAHNHEPGNAGILRLIDLAEFTIECRKHGCPSAPPATDLSAQDKARLAAIDKQLNDQLNSDLAKGMDDFNRDYQLNNDLAKAIDNFNRNYLPKHPELLQPVKPSAAAQPEETKDNWNSFFDVIFALPKDRLRILHSQDAGHN
jgi:hypothetical protein